MRAGGSLKSLLREKSVAVPFSDHEPHIELPGIETEVLKWEAGI